MVFGKKIIMDAGSLREQGNALLRSGDHAGAVDRYTAGLAIDPNDSLLLSNRSAALLALGKAEDAVKDADAAIAADPKFARAHARSVRNNRDDDGKTFFSLINF